MNNMTLQQLYVTLLVGGLVLLASIVATRAAAKVGLPSLLLFLAVGVALGNDGLGLEFNDVQLASDLGTTALAVILVEGGLTTRFADIRKLLAPAGVLANRGVKLSGFHADALEPPCGARDAAAAEELVVAMRGQRHAQHQPQDQYSDVMERVI